jgi:hypothetical protein
MFQISERPTEDGHCSRSPTPGRRDPRQSGGARQRAGEAAAGRGCACRASRRVRVGGGGDGRGRRGCSVLGAAAVSGDGEWPTLTVSYPMAESG